MWTWDLGPDQGWSHSGLFNLCAATLGVCFRIWQVQNAGSVLEPPSFAFHNPSSCLLDRWLRSGMVEKGPTSPISPLAQFPPLLPTESRSRAPEFYGFVAWTSTYLLFCVYLLWALLPDKCIIALGITWYPNR